MTDLPAPDGWSEGDVDVDGVRLHYYRSGGDGRPFVVAHGITSSGRSRIPLVEDLAGFYDVLAYDARGHGRSAAPDAGYAPADLATDLLGLVDALDLEDPVLYGHSMGGTTVATAAATRPELPHAVVLEDPGLMLRLDEGDGSADGDSGGPGDEPDDGLVDGSAEGQDDEPADDPGLATMLERIRGRPAGSREELLDVDPELRALVGEGREHLATLLADAYLNVDPAVEQVLQAGAPDPGAVFPDVAAPTLILKADAAPGAREVHRAAAAHLPGGELVHVDGAGHCVLRDEYEAAYGTVREFMEAN